MEQPLILDTLTEAIRLADALARVKQTTAHVVNDQGHPMLALASDLGGDGELPYWTQDQIVYTAAAQKKGL